MSTPASSTATTPTASHANISKTRSNSMPSERGRHVIRGAMTASASQHEPHSSNIVQFALSGNYSSDKPVLIDAADTSRFITRDRAQQLVASLTGAFEEDSTVCLHLDNDILYPILCLAIFASKSRWTGTNPAYKAGELEHHFRISKTKYVITTENRLDTVIEAIEKSGTKAEVILFTDILTPRVSEPSPCPRIHDSSSKKSVYRTLDQLQKSSTVRILRQVIRDIKLDAVATLMATSGTTGLPKMAARTHRATVLEASAIEDNLNAKDYPVRRLFCTPIFHAFSTPDMVINTIRLGLPTYFMKRFDDTLFPQAVQDHRITETWAPPAILLRLVNNPASHAKIQSLRNIYTGGSALTSELRAKFDRLFSVGPPAIAQVWGQTESGWYTTFKYPEQDNTGSVGRAVPNVDIRMSDEHSMTTLAGEKAGEMLIRSPHLMQGYYGNPKATKETFTEDGWLKTGDIGFVRDGKVFLVDRAKDLVKVNGFQVSPTEIENTLMKLDDSVRDCAVIGVDTDVDEHPYAFVVRTHKGVEAEFLKRYLLDSLISYKVSKCEIAFVDSIPRSVSGKILKKDLLKVARLS